MNALNPFKRNWSPVALAGILALPLALGACKPDKFGCTSDDPANAANLKAYNEAKPEGVTAAIKDNEVDYKRGYDLAMSYTREDGVKKGQADAYAAGKTKGDTEGYPVDVDKGRTLGLQDQNAIQQGVADGEGTGRIDGRTKGLNDGYASGFKKGYDLGSFAAQNGMIDCEWLVTKKTSSNRKSEPQAKDVCSAEGYNEGYKSKRKESEYNRGLEQGWKDNTKYADGYKEGRASKESYDKGYADGYKAGKDRGYQDGIVEGRKIAYTNAKNAAYQVAFNAAYTPAVTEAFGQSPSTTQDGQIVGGAAGQKDGFWKGASDVCTGSNKVGN